MAQSAPSAILDPHEANTELTTSNSRSQRLVSMGARELEHAEYNDPMFLENALFPVGFQTFGRRLAANLQKFFDMNDPALRDFYEVQVTNVSRTGTAWNRTYQLPTSLTVLKTRILDYVVAENEDWRADSKVFDLYEQPPSLVFIDESGRQLIVLSVDPNKPLIYACVPSQFIDSDEVGNMPDDVDVDPPTYTSVGISDVVWLTELNNLDPDLRLSIVNSAFHAVIDEKQRALWFPVKTPDPDSDVGYTYRLWGMDVDRGLFHEADRDLPIQHVRDGDIPAESFNLRCTFFSRFDMCQHMVFGPREDSDGGRYYVVAFPHDWGERRPTPWRSFAIPAETEFDVACADLASTRGGYPPTITVRVDHQNLLVCSLRSRAKLYLSAADGREVSVLLNDTTTPYQFFFVRFMAAIDFVTEDVPSMSRLILIGLDFKVSRGELRWSRSGGYHIVNLYKFTERAPALLDYPQRTLETLLSDSTRTALRSTIAGMLFDEASPLQGLSTELLVFKIFSYLDSDAAVPPVDVSAQDNQYDTEESSGSFSDYDSDA